MAGRLTNRQHGILLAVTFVATVVAMKADDDLVALALWLYMIRSLLVLGARLVKWLDEEADKSMKKGNQ